MILRTAVEAFLKRPRDDFRQCLKWDEADIEHAVGKLAVRPPIFKHLRRSQRICVLVGAHQRRFAYYNDMGTGKTFIALALAAYHAKALGSTRGAIRFLVLVPNRVNIRGWLEQVNKHAPELAAVAMPSSMQGKLDTLSRSKALLYVDTYAGFTRLCSVMGRKGKASKMRPNPKMLDRMAQLLTGIIADESSAIGHHDSLQTEVLTNIVKRDRSVCVYLLSGTPFGRDPHLLWSQMRLLDDGHTLGSTLGLFRTAFFRTIENPFGGRQYEFLKKQTNHLNRCIAHRSIRFELDAADLPAVSNVPVHLDLAAEPAKYYEAAVAQLRASKGHYEICKSAFMRMRQISSGFINIKDPETGERERLEFADNPKLEWVKSQIEGMDGQVIIFHDFHYSGEVLQRELTAIGVGHTIINGRISDAQLQRAYDDFTQGRRQVLLLNSQAGAYGSNLQMAKYGIYYESPVPVIIRKQTELRFIRPGSMHHNVVKIDLVMNNTVDAAILKFHEQGENLFQAILNGRFRL